MFRKVIISKIILLVLILGIALSQAFSSVIEEKGKTYIVDRHGERWDVTQARSIGFEPHRFQHGIGRNAFRPLGDSDWSNGVNHNTPNFRIIGVVDGDEAQAFSVLKLSYHEIANTKLASGPIAAGY